jgi:hypothetical protein
MAGTKAMAIGKPALSGKKKAVAVPKGKKAGRAKGRAAKRSFKKVGAKAKKSSPAVGSLDREAASVYKALLLARAAFEKNETEIAKKVSEKMRIDAEMNSLFRKNFAVEKQLLDSVKKDSAEKEEGLRKQIASLEKITGVYDEKKARINQARQRQAALKKQLLMLEKQAGS